MTPYRAIVGLALLPRAFRLLGILTVVALAAVALPATCAAVVVGSAIAPAASDAPAALESGTRSIGPAGMRAPEPLCFQSDVKALCCPSACAAKRDVHLWPRANDVLRGCAKGIGCKSVDSWTVGMRCNCDAPR